MNEDFKYSITLQATVLVGDYKMRAVMARKLARDILQKGILQYNLSPIHCRTEYLCHGILSALSLDVGATENNSVYMVCSYFGFDPR